MEFNEWILGAFVNEGESRFVPSENWVLIEPPGEKTWQASPHDLGMFVRGPRA